MTSAQFAYVWEYSIHPERREEFLAAYHPEGEWAALFRRDPAYLGTKLLRDADDAYRFVTIDYWASREDRDAFRVQYRDAFDALDRRCEAYTKHEVFLGDFVDVEIQSAIEPALP